MSVEHYFFTYRLGEILEELEKAERARLLLEFLQRLPPDVRSEVEKYVRPIEEFRIICIGENGEIGDITEFVPETAAYDECARVERRHAGYRVEGSIPFDLFKKYSFFIPYVEPELALKVFLAFCRERPLLRCELHRKEYPVYEDERYLVTEWYIWDDITPDVVLYEKVYIPELGLEMLKRVGSAYGWEEFAKKYPEIYEKVKKREEEEKRRTEKIISECLQELKSGEPTITTITTLLKHVDMLSRDDINMLRKAIEKLLQELVPRAIKEIEEWSGNAHFVDLEQIVEALGEAVKKRGELAHLYDEYSQVYNKMKKIRQEKAKRVEELNRKAERMLKLTQESIVEDLKKYEKYLHLEANLGFRRCIIRVEFRRYVRKPLFDEIVMTLKKLGFTFNPETRKWIMEIEAEIDYKHENVKIVNRRGKKRPASKT